MSTLTRFAISLLIAATGLQAYGSKASSDSLLASAVAHEHDVLKATLESHPIVETYVQRFAKGSDTKLEKDSYSIAAVGRGRTIGEDEYRREVATGLVSRLLDVAKVAEGGVHEEIDGTAFADMLTLDPAGLNSKTYRFEFHRQEFIGSRRMSVYDVFPADKRRHAQRGRFLGRIWIDQQDAVITRFDGVFSGPASNTHPEFLHFDSWRKRTVSGTWVPYAVYIEDSIRGSAIHAQIRFWGYHLDKIGSQDDSNLTNVEVENAQDESESSGDVSPLESTIGWKKQAETNVVKRLEKAGLLAPAGDFEKVLDQIVINLSVPSNLNFHIPVHCRVLLTSPIEATVAGNTILISKGLVDTIPSEEVLASVLALELAHIQLGHQMDTRYAFIDRLMFANTETYERLRLLHSEEDNKAAAAEAHKLLAASMYGDKLPSVSPYYSVLSDLSMRLRDLTHGYIGDSLLDTEGQSWFHSWLYKVPPQTAYAVLDQVPFPLSSSLAIDPESDQVHQIVPRIAPSRRADLYPFEILPVWLNFQSDKVPTRQNEENNVKVAK